MDETFLKMLRCPITSDALEVVGADLLRRATEAQLSSALHDRQGLLVDAFEIGLVNTGGQWFYPVRNDIPSLIPDQAVEIANIPCGEDSPANSTEAPETP